MILFHLVIPLEVELLDHIVYLFLILVGTSILFSVVATPINIPMNSVQVFPFLHIISKTSYLLPLLITAVLTVVR